MSDKESAKAIKERLINTWTVEKIALAKDWIDNEETQIKRKLARGSIHFCKFGENIGSEQNEERPVLIISNDLINSTSGNVMVVPLTKNLKKKKGTNLPRFKSHYFLLKNKYSFLTYDSAAKTEETTSVNKIRLTGHLGNISEDDLNKIMVRAKWVLGI